MKQLKNMMNMIPLNFTDIDIVKRFLFAIVRSFFCIPRMCKNNSNRGPVPENTYFRDVSFYFIVAIDHSELIAFVVTSDLP